jgi:hypothetical protein
MIAFLFIHVHVSLVPFVWRINSNYLFTEPEIKDLLNIFFLYLVLTPNVTKVQVENVTTLYE